MHGTTQTSECHRTKLSRPSASGRQETHLKTAMSTFWSVKINSLKDVYMGESILTGNDHLSSEEEVYHTTYQPCTTHMWPNESQGVNNLTISESLKAWLSQTSQLEQINTFRWEVKYLLHFKQVQLPLDNTLEITIIITSDNPECIFLPQKKRSGVWPLANF